MIQCRPLGLNSDSQSSIKAFPVATSLATGFSLMTCLPACQACLMVSGWLRIGKLRMTVWMSERAKRALRSPSALLVEDDPEEEESQHVLMSEDEEKPSLSASARTASADPWERDQTALREKSFASFIAGRCWYGEHSQFRSWRPRSSLKYASLHSLLPLQRCHRLGRLRCASLPGLKSPAV